MLQHPGLKVLAKRAELIETPVSQPRDPVQVQLALKPSAHSGETAQTGHKDVRAQHRCHRGERP